MKFSIAITIVQEDEILVLSRFENNGIVGDLSEVLKPGDSFVGISFKQLFEKGSGFFTEKDFPDVDFKEQK